MGSKTKIVILGGGFAGCFTAKYLEKKLKKHPEIEISLINHENYFVFQPLLPEVVAGSISFNQILNPIRRLLPETNFYASDVESIDLDKKHVTITVGKGRHHRQLEYDHLVVALGTIVNLSALPGMAEHSIPMKNLGDAFYLRNHVIGCLEEADFEPDPELKAALCTFVVVGGGFSGVETIAELQEMVHKVLKLYKNIHHDEVRFILVHSRERILPEVVPGLADYAQKKLAARGIEFKLKVRCKAATADSVILNNEEEIMSKTIICTIGNAPNPMVSTLNCKKERGKVFAEPTLKLVDRDNVWALGDCAWVLNQETGEPYEPTAQNAIRQAACLAENIISSIENKPLKPFIFGGLGKLASIGNRSAVAEVMGMKISGFIAWIFWRAVYLMKLPGWERRIRVLLDWNLDLIFPRSVTQLKVFRTEKINQEHYEEGQNIVEQGEIGDKFYIIVEGEVEVIREQDSGEKVKLTNLKSGEYFGEVALLQDVPRTATVRTTKPTDVLCLGRGDFAAVAEHFSVLKASVQQTLQERTGNDSSPQTE